MLGQLILKSNNFNEQQQRYKVKYKLLLIAARAHEVLGLICGDLHLHVLVQLLHALVMGVLLYAVGE